MIRSFGPADRPVFGDMDNFSFSVVWICLQFIFHNVHGLSIVKNLFLSLLFTTLYYDILEFKLKPQI